MSDCIMKSCNLNVDDNTNYLIHEELQKQITELLNTTTAKFLLQDQKIAELCCFIKENLDNSLRELLYDMKDSGEMDQIITDAVLSSIRKLNMLTSHYVTPQMYGAMGNGITDDTEAFQKAVNDADVSCIVIPNGTYRITKEIIIDRENITIIGSCGAGMLYGTVILQCEGCNGFNIVSGSRFITIAGFEIRGNSMDSGCGIRFTGDKTITKLTVRDMHINIFKYGIANCVDNVGKAVVLWNCEFDNIHFYSGDLQSQYSFYLSAIPSAGDSFGLMFKNIFVGHSTAIINQVKGVFDCCNFGVIDGTTLEFNRSYLVFRNCNFECDAKVNNSYIMKFGNMSYCFENCQFVIHAESNTIFFKPTSSTMDMEFKGCYAYVYDDNEGKFWEDSGSELVKNGGIRFIGYNSPTMLPDFTSGFYQSTIQFANGLLKYNDKHENISDLELRPFYSVDREQVETVVNGEIQDVYGNCKTEYGKFPVKLGNGFYLDGGELSVTGDIVTVNYNRKVDGKVFVACEPLNGLYPIMACRDESADYKDKPNYAVFRIKMWDKDNKTWVNNTKDFTLKWIKVSL